MTGSGGFPGGIDGIGMTAAGARPGTGLPPGPEPGFAPSVAAGSVAWAEAGGLGLSGKLGAEALDLVDAAARHTAAYGVAVCEGLGRLMWMR